MCKTSPATANGDAIKLGAKLEAVLKDASPFVRTKPKGLERL